MSVLRSISKYFNFKIKNFAYYLLAIDFTIFNN